VEVEDFVAGSGGGDIHWDGIHWQARKRSGRLEIKGIATSVVFLEFTSGLGNEKVGRGIIIVWPAAPLFGGRSSPLQEWGMEFSVRGEKVKSFCPEVPGGLVWLPLVSKVAHIFAWPKVYVDSALCSKKNMSTRGSRDVANRGRLKIETAIINAFDGIRIKQIGLKDMIHNISIIDALGRRNKGIIESDLTLNRLEEKAETGEPF
jgi:hypothetical protein